MKPSSMRWTAAALALLLPLTSHAEVMDKETPPWEPLPILVTLGAATLCFFLARQPRRTLLLPALVVAVLWAVLRFNDDLYSADVGPAIRTELSGAAFLAYEWLLPIQALLPAASLLLGLARRRAGLRGDSQLSA
jgi:hypothetical protein